MKRLLIILSFALIFAFSELSFAQVVRDSWSFGFGGAFPRFLSTDVRPQEANYGGYISLQRYFSEKVALRIKGSYLSMEGRIGGGEAFYAGGVPVPSVTEYTRTNLIAGNVDLIFNLSPCSPVSPYFGAGVGFGYFMTDWQNNQGTVVNPADPDGDYGGEFNIIFGSEIRLSNNWDLNAEVSLHSIGGTLDGFNTTAREGVFGGNNDAYMVVNLGLQYYFSKGEESNYCELYDGITAELPAMDIPTLDQVEEVIKRYSSEPAEVDYNRIEDIVKKYRQSAAADDNWKLFGVNFEFNKSSLQPEAYPVLEHAVEVLKDNRDIKVEIQGHTDNIGSDAYNQKLSEARAKTVRDYLVQQGVDAGRLTTVGYGESKPVADNNTDMGRAQNRRVEFKVSR